MAGDMLIVCHQDDCDSALTTQRFKERHNFDTGFAIQRTGWLIGQEYAGS